MRVGIGTRTSSVKSASASLMIEMFQQQQPKTILSQDTVPVDIITPYKLHNIGVIADERGANIESAGARLFADFHYGHGWDGGADGGIR